jgi:hypothetical protein
MKAFRWLVKAKNDPMIDRAEALIRTANSTAASAFGPALKEFSILRSIYNGCGNQADFVGRFEFMMTIACVYAAIQGLRKVDIEENRTRAVIDRLELRLLEWNATDSVSAFEDCKNFVIKEYAELAKAGYDRNYAAPDAIGSWVVSNILPAPPSSEEERRLIRSVGTVITQKFGNWWV